MAEEGFRAAVKGQVHSTARCYGFMVYHGPSQGQVHHVTSITMAPPSPHATPCAQSCRALH